MRQYGGATGRRISAIVAVITVFGSVFASLAFANNLDRNTAQNAAREIAKKECRQTSGCTGWAANNVKLITFHRAQTKIFVNSVKNGIEYQCRQQTVIRLDHSTGRITYGLSQRKCTNLGPA